MEDMHVKGHLHRIVGVLILDLVTKLPAIKYYDKWIFRYPSISIDKYLRCGKKTRLVSKNTTTLYAENCRPGKCECDKSGAKQIRCLPEAVAVSRETTGWLYFFTEQEND